MGVGYWENLEEEEEEEEEDERNKEGKKKSRGSIDRLSDRFLFLFLFPSSFFFFSFEYFFPRRKKTITHHSASRSHLASKHISFSLSPTQGTLWTSTPGTN